MRTLATACLVVAAVLGQQPADRIVITKSTHTMVLMQSGKILHSYKVALSTESGPKEIQGDHKTPEGIYQIDAKNPQSRFYKALHISYPSTQQSRHARELGRSAGGDVEIHALPAAYAWLGESHRLHDWTDGCIAVTDAEMDEIWPLVAVGTTVEIKP